MLKDIWKLNVSTTLILPLFDSLTKDVLIGRDNITFTQLCFLYKLQKCYLNDHADNLILVFFREDVSKKMHKTNIKFWSFTEFIVTQPCYEKFEIYNDYIIFYLKIDKKYINDIQKIRATKYSLVSKDYTQAVNVKNCFKRLHITDTLGDTLSSKNICMSILIKDPYMKDLIEDFLNITLPNGNEYFKLFDDANEIFNEKMLTI